MSSITELAERMSSLGLAQLPGEVFEAVRQRLFDTWASFIAGSATAEAALLRDMIGPKRAPLAEGMRYVCAATRCTEIDDIHIGSCTTVGSIVVPVALVHAANDALPDGDVLCSIVAGYEAMTRLGCAVDGAHKIYQGIWGTYLAAPLTAAVVTARLMQLDAGKTAHAMAIAAARSTGMTTRVAGERSPRWYMAGSAAAEGYHAARAAAAGMEGDVDLLEQGFGRAAGVEFDAAEFSRDPAHWRILDIDTKPFQTSRQGLSATEAFLRLTESRNSADIQAIEVRTPEQVMPLVGRPTQLGLRQQLAEAAADRQALWDVAGRRSKDQVTIDAIKAKIELTADAKLTALYPEQWGGRVRITWADHTSDELEVLDPHGSAANPFGWGELVDKHREVGQAFGHADVSWLDRLQALCRGFGQKPDASHSLELVNGFSGKEYLH